jgi:methyl-accepting chemotaxis protein
MITPLRNLSLPLKIAIAPTLLVAILFMLGLTASWLLKENRESVTALEREVLLPMEMAERFDTALDDTMTAVYLLVSISATKADPAKIALIAKDASKQIESVQSRAERFEAEIAQGRLPEAEVQEIRTNLDEFLKGAKLVVGTADTDPGTTLALTNAARQNYDVIAAQLDDVLETYRQMKANRESVLKHSMQEASLLFSIVAVAAGTLSILLTVAIVRRVSAPVVALTRALEALARHDYSITVPGLDMPDELGTMARAIDGLRLSAAETEQLRRAQTEDREQAGREKKASLEVMAWTVEREILHAVEQINRETGLMADMVEAARGDAQGTSAAASNDQAAIGRALHDLIKVVRTLAIELDSVEMPT